MKFNKRLSEKIHNFLLDRKHNAARQERAKEIHVYTQDCEGTHAFFPLSDISPDISLQQYDRFPFTLQHGINTWLEADDNKFTNLYPSTVTGGVPNSFLYC